jgi:transcriptional regulator with XRE-family HTH domain
LREARGWGTGALSRRSGVSRTALHNIETGHTPNPRAATLKKLAEAFQISVAQLLAGPTKGERADACGGEGSGPPWNSHESERRMFDRHTNPMVDEVRAMRPRLFTSWSGQDWDELYSEFGVGGALTFEGVVQAAENINRKRETLRQLSVVLDTGLGEVAARLVATLHALVEAPEKMGPTPRSSPAP